MPATPLLDTDVMIDYLRRRPTAIAFIRTLSTRPAISAVTVGELYTGVREGSERTELEAVVRAFRVIPVTRETATLAGLYRRQYRASHNVQLADAFIAAAAELIKAELYTLNVKHYPMFVNLRPPYIR